MTDRRDKKDEKKGIGEVPVPFAFFTEIGILNQLVTAMLAKALPDGVHPSHFGILLHLSRTGDGVTPIRIASAMQVTKATMTHSLRVLEDHGFIRIAPNPEDGRGKLVFLTPSGGKFLGTAIKGLAARFGPVFNQSHKDMMHRTLDDLRALRQHLDENR